MSPLSPLSFFFLIVLLAVGQSTPTDPSYYEAQAVNHFSSDPSSTTYTQRFYESSKYFSGPGHPIFLVMGGEGAIEPSTGLFYPFINEVLASKFGAYVIQPEHRFYGESIPVVNATNDDLQLLMTPEQVRSFEAFTTTTTAINNNVYSLVAGTSRCCRPRQLSSRHLGLHRQRYPDLLPRDFCGRLLPWLPQL